MNKMIAYCGIDCGKCDAFIATQNDDQVLREKTAKLWSEMNNATILPEQINCDGCRMEGRKTVFCANICTTRQCAVKKGMETCGHCPDMENCTIVATLHVNNPEAMHNLTHYNSLCRPVDEV